MDLVTLAEAKTYLDLTGNTDDDTLLAQLITQVSADVVGFLGIPFPSSSDIVEYLDGGQYELAPSTIPLISVTSIVDNLLSETQDVASYIVNTDENCIYRDPPTIWPKGLRRWIVTYDAGMDTATEDIKKVVLEEIARYYGNRNQSLSQQTSQDSQHQYRSDLSPQAKRVLSRRKSTGF